jgi:DNA-binding transcriptional LysR family regulator
MKPGTPVATLIGDLVGSRQAPDRAGLHQRFRDALREVEAAVPTLTPLRITVGDEFQGCFQHVGAAAAAALRLRLFLLPEADVRFGIGWGLVTVLERTPRVEDGPGWWAARDAIEAVARDADKAALRSTRTLYRCAAETPGPDGAAVNAALRLRDQQVGSLDARSLSVLRGLLDGMPQTSLAEQLGVSASAVSQRIRSDGLAVLVAAESALGEVR